MDDAVAAKKALDKQLAKGTHRKRSTRLDQPLTILQQAKRSQFDSIAHPPVFGVALQEAEGQRLCWLGWMAPRQGCMIGSRTEAGALTRLLVPGRESTIF
jgi:hypothetical protein